MAQTENVVVQNNNKNMPQNNNGKIGGGMFFLIAIVGMLIEALIVVVESQFLILYVLIVLVIGFPFFLKSRKATKPNIYVYGTIFFSSAIFSIFGIIIAYLMFKGKNLVV